jgi:hypothetical protein
MGLFVEEFPDPLAGAPISNKRNPPPDLGAYMRSVGDLADPKHFETAELLMTTGLTNAAKDRHLKSTMVSTAPRMIEGRISLITSLSKYAGRTPWDNCDAMLSNIDKLAHGPQFTQYTIPIFDGRRPRPQYMICRDIIKITRDFFANPAFKNHMRYKPWRLYTSATKTERVYADMAASDWWWKELVRNMCT